MNKQSKKSLLLVGAVLGGGAIALMLAKQAQASSSTFSAQSKVDELFRRANATEIPADIVAQIPGLLLQPIGAVHFFTSQGKEWAVVIEEQTGPLGKHKGATVYVRRD